MSNIKANKPLVQYNQVVRMYSFFRVTLHSVTCVSCVILLWGRKTLNKLMRGWSIERLNRSHERSFIRIALVASFVQMSSRVSHKCIPISKRSKFVNYHDACANLQKAQKATNASSNSQLLNKILIHSKLLNSKLLSIWNSNGITPKGPLGPWAPKAP